MKTIPREIVESLSWISLARNGDWPCAGGLLDQSAAFVDAFRIVGREVNRLEAEAAKRG